MSILYSIVVPLKNEAENVTDLYEEIVPVMEALKKPWELLFIEDGSTDATLPVITTIAAQDPRVRVLVFDRNYGQSSAFDAGFRAALGEWVITLDGDRQNDPADIPRLIEKSANYDLVCGFRRKRRDPWHKRITSKLANRVRGWLCQDAVRDTGCSLKLYRKDCLNRIKMYQGMHRFLPALFLIEGFRITEVPVNHRERVRGATKYTFLNRSFNTIADMLAVRWMRKRRLHYQLRQRD